MAPVAAPTDTTEKAWSKTASNYASNVGRTSVVIAGRLLELASSLRPISSTSAALDVGAGTGAVAITLAREHPECRVLATDLSPKMLLAIDEHHLPNVSTQTVNALELGSLPGTFSHAFSSFMLQLTTTPIKVLEGMKDRLEPGGVIGLAVWGERADPFDIWQQACQTLDPSFSTGPEFDDPGAWRTPGELKMHMEIAGFEHVIVENTTTSFEFPSTDAFVEFWFSASNPGADKVIQMWTGDLEIAKEATRKVCRERYQDGHGITLQAALGVGRKSN